MKDDDQKQNEEAPMSRMDKAKAIAGLLIVGYIFDFHVSLARAFEDISQWILMFVVLFWLVAASAWDKGERSARTIFDIAWQCAALLLVFAFLTGGRGCSPSPGTYSDCRPAGPGIYNDC